MKQFINLAISINGKNVKMIDCTGAPTPLQTLFNEDQ